MRLKRCLLFHNFFLCWSSHCDLIARAFELLSVVVSENDILLIWLCYQIMYQNVNNTCMRRLSLVTTAIPVSQRQNCARWNCLSYSYRVSQKSEPLNILQQQPQICSDLNKILHTQDDICYKHNYIYKSALTLLKYEFLNNITHKSWVSIAVDVSQNSQNVHSSKRPVSSRKFSH